MTGPAALVAEIEGDLARLAVGPALGVLDLKRIKRDMARDPAASPPSSGATCRRSGRC